MSSAGDILQVEGINAKGYGIIPKLVMQDKRLTATAKAIYAYFCSYAGTGKTAFPSVGKITTDLGMSKGNYYKHFGLLKDYGYIKTEQVNGEGGLFTRNVYTLVETIPCTKICDTVAPCTNLPHTVPPYAVKRHTNNNSLQKQQIDKSNRSCQSSRASCRQQAVSVSPQAVQDMTAKVQEQIEYEYFKANRNYLHDMGLMDEIVAIIVDALLCEDDTIRLDGENKHRELVKQRLKELDAECVKHVLGTFQGLTEPIKRKRQYLLTMLYNSRLELEAHYTNMVQTDFYGSPNTSRKEKNHQQW